MNGKNVAKKGEHSNGKRMRGSKRNSFADPKRDADAGFYLLSITVKSGLLTRDGL